MADLKFKSVIEPLDYGGFKWVLYVDGESEPVSTGFCGKDDVETAIQRAKQWVIDRLECLSHEPIPVNLQSQMPTMTSGLYCSFCGKHKDQVLQLIAGAKGFICNECVQLCACVMVQKHPEWRDTLERALSARLDFEK